MSHTDNVHGCDSRGVQLLKGRLLCVQMHHYKSRRWWSLFWPGSKLKARTKISLIRELFCQGKNPFAEIKGLIFPERPTWAPNWPAIWPWPESSLLLVFLCGSRGQVTCFMDLASWSCSEGHMRSRMKCPADVRWGLPSPWCPPGLFIEESELEQGTLLESGMLMSRVFVFLKLMLELTILLLFVFGKLENSA